MEIKHHCSHILLSITIWNAYSSEQIHLTLITSYFKLTSAGNFCLYYEEKKTITLESLVILQVMSLIWHFGKCFAVTRIAMLILHFKRHFQTLTVRTVSCMHLFFYPFQNWMWVKFSITVIVNCFPSTLKFQVVGQVWFWKQNHIHRMWFSIPLLLIFISRHLFYIPGKF